MAESHVNLPFIVALTGGIAAGKTLVSDAFRKLGVVVIDTDIIAHRIVEPGLPACLEIESAFGKKVLDKNGRLRRDYLRELIFTDPGARKKLESILHPKIRAKVSHAIACVKNDYCILVIPLLAERSTFPVIDRVLVVDVDSETQISRLMSRDKSTRRQAEQALAAQIGREQRLRIADDVLENSGTPEAIRIAVSELNMRYTKLARNRR